MNGKAVVTGGGGFIGAYLVKKLVQDGWKVTCIDSLARGSNDRLKSVNEDIEILNIDVRHEGELIKAFKGAKVVFHLAAINGTENFYKQPELVFDVGVLGAISVINACRISNVKDLVVASSAEVYQTPLIVPTDENIALTLPNSINPRYSYGGSKIASEIIAFNYGIDFFEKMQVFRPHNIYGPDMGWKHVVPNFIVRAMECINNNSHDFKIQGNGLETRSFCYVDDVVDGILNMYSKGLHRQIYHIGNDHEISIRDLALMIGETMDIELNIKPGLAKEGGTSRRCPNINKMRKLGYSPQVQIQEGIKRTIDWYVKNNFKNQNTLM